MKKNMFNIWYEKYGRELAKKTLPIDDVDEKEIRAEAKKIFSYTYDLFSELMNDRLCLVQDFVLSQISYLDNLLIEIEEKKEIANVAKSSIVARMTELYDSYYKDKFLTKELFDSLRSYFAPINDSTNSIINNCNNDIKEIKREKKLLNSLLIR